MFIFKKDQRNAASAANNKSASKPCYRQSRFFVALLSNFSNPFQSLKNLACSKAYVHLPHLHFVFVERVKIQVNSDGSRVVLCKNLVRTNRFSLDRRYSIGIPPLSSQETVRNLDSMVDLFVWEARVVI